ncbi:MAG: ABC transporter permease [Oscillospiraceae bacterium]
MEEKTKKGFGETVKRALNSVWNMKESGIIIPTIIYAIFVQLVNPVFFSSVNIANLLRQTGFVLISALGMTLVLIAGGIDLSVGSVLGLGGVVAGFCMVNFGLPIWLSVLIALACGFVIGTINGYTIMKFNIPPMIMTLGMMYMARGAVFISTKGWPIYPIPLAFQKIEQSEILGVPTIIPICLVLCVIFQFLLTRTTFGRSIYALGGNKDAAKLSGINVKKIQVLVFSISGLMATFTGIMMAARLGSAQPSSGEGNEMNVIAACIIGGTSTFGGRGTVLGTAIGALFMSMLSNSMTLMKVDIYYQKLVIGAVLVIAVILDQYKRDMAQSKSLKKS